MGNLISSENTLHPPYPRSVDLVPLRNTRRSSVRRLGRRHGDRFLSPFCR